MRSLKIIIRFAIICSACLTGAVWQPELVKLSKPQKPLQKSVSTVGTSVSISTHNKFSYSDFQKLIWKITETSDLFTTPFGKLKVKENSVLEWTTTRWPLQLKNHDRYTISVTYDKNKFDGVINSMHSVIHFSPTTEKRPLLFFRRNKQSGFTISITGTDEGLAVVATEIPNTDSYNEHTQVIVESTLSFVEAAIRNELGRLAARRRQSAEHASREKARMEAAKHRQVDEILHPDKYRSKKSAGVTKGPAGSGRYRPSEAAQARRQVKKK